MSERSPRTIEEVYGDASITPMLSVRHGARAVDFYEAAFAAKTLFRFDAEDGSVIAKLAVGKAEFWVSDESPEHGNFSPESIGGTSVRLIVVLDDPHAAFDYAVTAGAKVLCPVTDEPYGWRIGRILDPFGHVWEIGKEI